MCKEHNKNKIQIQIYFAPHSQTAFNFVAAEISVSPLFSPQSLYDGILPGKFLSFHSWILGRGWLCYPFQGSQKILLSI